MFSRSSLSFSFSSPRPRIAGARFLDLYAGTGAVGIEALSRGARSATFVEKDPACVQLLNDNLASLNFAAQARVVRADATNDLSSLEGPFDLIFMGPPYKDAEKKALALVTPTLETIHRSGLLSQDGIVIAQHHTKETVGSFADWDLYREERYGDSLVSFFRPKTS